jgi:hypothetical protein
MKSERAPRTLQIGAKTAYIQAAAASGRRRRAAMLRIAVIALIVIVAWIVIAKLVRDIRAAKVDWKGWAFIAGFIALAFYLRHVTGIGDF